jgi:hypothetical protein
MTSTLIRKIDRGFIERARMVLRKNVVAAGIDSGTESTKVALVGTHAGRPVLHKIIDEPGRPSAATVSVVNQQADVRVCGLGGHEVKTYRMVFPPIPHRELDILVRRRISLNMHKEAVVAFETRPAGGDKVEVSAAASSGGLLSRVLEGLEGAGVGVKGAYADVSALAECARFARRDIDGKCVSVFTIGAAWSHLLLLEKGRMVFSRSMRIGIDDFVGTASDLCGISREEARDMVFSAGVAVSPEDCDSGDALLRSYAESVREVGEQLMVEIQRTLSYTSIRHGLRMPEVILICGGATQVAGMGGIISRETGIEVEVLDPLEALAKGEDYKAAGNGSLFCVAIGLALLALRPDSPCLMPAVEPRKGALERRLTAGLAVALGLLLITAVGGRVLDSAAGRYGRAVEEERRVLAEARSESVTGLVPEEPGLVARAHTYGLLTGSSPRWTGVLKEISLRTPDGIVFEEMEFSCGEAAPGVYPEWKLLAGGVVTGGSNSTTALLIELKEALESSDLFSNVEVMPRGIVAFDYGGEILPGAVRFELGADLE